MEVAGWSEGDLSAAFGSVETPRQPARTVPNKPIISNICFCDNKYYFVI